MTSDGDQPEIEITDEIRQQFFSYIGSMNRRIRRLRFSLLYIRGCGIVVVAISTVAILTSGIVELLPGGGLSVAVLSGDDRYFPLVCLGAAIIELYCALKCAKRLKGAQMHLKEARDAGIHHGLIAQ